MTVAVCGKGDANHPRGRVRGCSWKAWHCRRDVVFLVELGNELLEGRLSSRADPLRYVEPVSPFQPKVRVVLPGPIRRPWPSKRSNRTKLRPLSGTPALVASWFVGSC